MKKKVKPIVNGRIIYFIAVNQGIPAKTLKNTTTVAEIIINNIAKLALT